MIVDPASAAIYAQQKEPVTPELAREQPKPQPPAAQTAQTHADGPAVVANFSAAALLSNRAVSAPLQAADQERVKEEREEARPAPRRQPEEAPPERGSRLDVRV